MRCGGAGRSNDLTVRPTSKFTPVRRLKRSDRRKIALTRLLRGRTAVPNEWIARELTMGHVTSVSRYCSEKFSAL